LISDIAPVPAEKFIAAVSRKNDLHVSASEPAKEIQRKARSVPERFIVMKYQRAECLDQVDILNVQLMMLRPEILSDYASI
jgi:hypothetical protein